MPRHVTAKVLTITALVGALALTACSKGAPSGSSAKLSPNNAVIQVTEKEWKMTPSIASVPAGKVSFLVSNTGQADHEMVLLKADKTASSLALDSTGKVNETAAGNNVGEVEVVAGSTGAATFNLAPGHYVMICNIPAHYKQGMFADFTVTGAPVQTSEKPAAPAAAAPAAAAVPGERKEIGLLKVVGPLLENTLAAAQKGDIPGASKALHQYDIEWHGVEVYLNFRSAKLYGELETTDQANLTKLLDDPKSSQADIVSASQELLNKWNESLTLMTSSPALSPIFDDLAAIRTLKAETINEIDPALKNGDVDAAKASFTEFMNRWPDVEDLVKAYSVDAYANTEAAMAKANTAFQKTKPDAAELRPLVATGLAQFNFGLNLINAAARNADTAKTAYTNDDVQLAVGSSTIQTELQASLAAWQAGKYQEAADHAQRASGASFANVSGALKAKNGADATLKKALDAYTAVAGAAGDATTVQAAQTAAVQAAAIAQQTLVGQFWTDSKFKTAYQAGVKQ